MCFREERFSIAERMSFPSSSPRGDATTVASGLCSFINARDSAVFSSDVSSVWLKTTQSAFSSWSRKNSPKFFAYIRHFFALTTVVFELTEMPSSPFSTAFSTSLSFPTPDGSIIILSGENCAVTF